MQKCRKRYNNCTSATPQVDILHGTDLLKLQIRSATFMSQSHRRFSWTGVSEVPCFFLLMIDSSPMTHGSSNLGIPMPRNCLISSPRPMRRTEPERSVEGAAVREAGEKAPTRAEDRSKATAGRMSWIIVSLGNVKIPAAFSAPPLNHLLPPTSQHVMTITASLHMYCS